jgi:hypothetical protein
MASLDQAKIIAKEIQRILGPNHVSTLIYGQFLEDVDRNVSSNIPLLIVIKKFDEPTTLKIYKVLKKFESFGIETPYIAELDDLSGMLDSIPTKLLDLRMRYQVLEGVDILELKTEPEYEYLRAQVELELRKTIYNLRHDLVDVMMRKISIDAYLKNLSLSCLVSIKYYHMVTHPDLRTNDQHLDYFYREFPDAKPSLLSLLEQVYSKRDDMPETDLLELITHVIDGVVQPMLIHVDQLGKKIIDYKMKKVDDIIEAKTREMKLEMLKEKMALVKQRKEVEAYHEKRFGDYEDKKKTLEKQLQEKKVPARTEELPYPYPPAYLQQMREMEDMAGKTPGRSKGPDRVERVESETVPVHEKELNVFEKILFENKTIKNTIRKQTDKRHSV